MGPPMEDTDIEERLTPTQYLASFSTVYSWNPHHTIPCIPSPPRTSAGYEIKNSDLLSVGLRWRAQKKKDKNREKGLTPEFNGSCSTTHLRVLNTTCPATNSGGGERGAISLGTEQ